MTSMSIERAQAKQASIDKLGRPYNLEQSSALPPRTNTWTQRVVVLLLQSKEKENPTFLCATSQSHQTGERKVWPEQEVLPCSAFIFLMNLSLLCGHSYCRADLNAAELKQIYA